MSLWELACKRIVPGNWPHLRQRFAGRPAPTREKTTCLCGSLPASESCRATGLTSGNDSPAGRLLQGKKRRVFVGACLQANRAGQLDSPQATIRRQVGSYKRKNDVSLWELACKRIVPGNWTHLRQRFVGRPAPTREKTTCLCGSLPASESRRATGLTSGNDSPAGRLLQGKNDVSLWELACKRIMPGNWPHLRQRFAGRPAPTGEAASCFCRSQTAGDSCRSKGIASCCGSDQGVRAQCRRCD